MGGIPQWSKNVAVSANPSKKIRALNLDFNTVIGAGANVSVDLYSPAGHVSRLVNMYLDYPAIAGATLGTVDIYVQGAGGLVGLVYAKNAYNLPVTYNYMEWYNANATQYPTNKAAQSSALQSGTFDTVNFLRFLFKNATDVSDVGILKSCRLWIEDEKVS